MFRVSRPHVIQTRGGCCRDACLIKHGGKAIGKSRGIRFDRSGSQWIKVFGQSANVEIIHNDPIFFVGDQMKHGGEVLDPAGFCCFREPGRRRGGAAVWAAQASRGRHHATSSITLLHVFTTSFQSPSLRLAQILLGHLSVHSF